MCQKKILLTIDIIQARISRIYTDKFIIFPCNPRNPCLKDRDKGVLTHLLLFSENMRGNFYLHSYNFNQ